MKYSATKYHPVVLSLIISLVVYSCAPYIHTFDGYEIKPVDILLRNDRMYENAYILAHNEEKVFISRTRDGSISDAVDVPRREIIRVTDENGNDVTRDMLSTDYVEKNAHYTEQIHQLMLTVMMMSGVLSLVAIAVILSEDN